MDRLINLILKNKRGRISLLRVGIVSSLAILILAGMLFYLPQNKTQADTAVAITGSSAGSAQGKIR